MSNNIICVKWGVYYTCEDVNKLYKMVKKNLTVPFNFYCITEISKDLDPEIIAKPIIPFSKKMEPTTFIFVKEAGLCDDNLADLNGERVLFFDLDMIITDNIDCLFDYTKNDDEFYIIKDWNTKSGTTGQASCYSWVVGKLGFVKKDYEDNQLEVYAKYGSAAQEYLSDMVRERFGKINFWPEIWFKSFKFHCLPIPIVRKFKNSKLPKGCKVLAFHGEPKIDSAMKGIWPSRSKYKKFFYKHLKPTTWLKKYFE